MRARREGVGTNEARYRGADAGRRHCEAGTSTESEDHNAKCQWRSRSSLDQHHDTYSRIRAAAHQFKHNADQDVQWLTAKQQSVPSSGTGSRTWQGTVCKSQHCVRSRDAALGPGREAHHDSFRVGETRRTRVRAGGRLELKHDQHTRLSAAPFGRHTAYRIPRTMVTLTVLIVNIRALIEPKDGTLATSKN